METSKVIELVKRYKSGEVEVFDQIYEASYKMVYLTCYGHLKNREDAEDVTQEVFTTVYKQLDTLNDDNTYFGWIKTIAVRKCLNSVRSIHESISFDDAIGIEEVIEGDDNLETLPDTYILKEEKRKIFAKILEENLSEVQYQTVFMFYYDEMSIAQIAQTMGCAENTVKTRLLSSRVKIKKGITEYEGETGDKLAAMGTIPFLSRFFQANLEQTQVPVVPFAGGASAIGGAAKGAATAAKAGLAKGAVVKGVAGIAAVALVGGAAIVIPSLMNKSKTSPVAEETTVPTVSSVVETETTVPTPTEVPVPTFDLGFVDYSLEVPVYDYVTNTDGDVYKDYVVDENGRVTDYILESDFYTDCSYHFEYDDMGNMIAKTTTYADGGNSETYSYSYDEHNNMLAEYNETFGYASMEASYVYDDQGRMTKATFSYYSWDINGGAKLGATQDITRIYDENDYYISSVEPYHAVEGAGFTGSYEFTNNAWGVQVSYIGETVFEDGTTYERTVERTIDIVGQVNMSTDSSDILNTVDNWVGYMEQGKLPTPDSCISAIQLVEETDAYTYSLSQDRAKAQLYYNAYLQILFSVLGYDVQETDGVAIVSVDSSQIATVSVGHSASEGYRMVVELI